MKLSQAAAFLALSAAYTKAQEDVEGRVHGFIETDTRDIKVLDAIAPANATASDSDFVLHALAIGDWGVTSDPTGSCCSRYKGDKDSAAYAKHRYAQDNVAALLGVSAETLKPKAVIGHGDSFYWQGILADDVQTRFQGTFESKYTSAALNIPWFNVMGNHDYGGGSYICYDGTDMAACGSTTELMAALKAKFTLQSGYKSPNNDRWKLTDHFYVHSIKDGDVSIDIFNLDTNDAESHGADQICCQCYGYSGGDDDKLCKTITRGHKYCAGGDTGMYDTCMKQFNDWGDEAKTKLAAAVKKSTATWKIVNTHYSPYAHYGETSAAKWVKALQGIEGLQLWINGHTHGEKHDFANFNMHFIENGAGGGIQSESASGIPTSASGWISNVWTAGGLTDGTLDGNTYGFFEIAGSKEWLKVRFLTFDSNWQLTTKDDGLKNGKIGGVAAKHCWYIPIDGTKGKQCTE